MKKILTLILALTMAVGLCACGGGEEAPAPEAEGGDSAAATLKIGGIGPLTGAVATYGVATQRGAQIAVDEINAMEDKAFESSREDILDSIRLSKRYLDNFII